MRARLQTTLTLGAILAIAIFAGCEGEQGPPGITGTQSCTESCHTDDYGVDDYILQARAEFNESQHALGDTYVRKGSPCSRCHTTEGYQYYLANGEPTSVTQSSPIGCFACHAPHTNENFAQRQNNSTDLTLGTTYNKGTSNSCAVCHQVREPSPSFASADPITSGYWGSHYGSQANILSGEGAWVFPGESYSANAMHNTIADGCVTCHMADGPSSGIAGGHSFKMAYAYRGSESVNSSGCDCHGWTKDSEATTAVEDRRAEYQASLNELADLLISLGWLNEDRARVNATEGEAPATADARGAVYNYQMLYYDRSGGVHNPTYADAILKATKGYATQQLNR
jgi:hypothetical protein